MVKWLDRSYLLFIQNRFYKSIFFKRIINISDSVNVLSILAEMYFRCLQLNILIF